MVIDNPGDRYHLAYNIERLFVRKLNKPEVFSRILLNKINSKSILQRIKLQLRSIEGDIIIETAWKNKLLKLQKRYRAHLKKYPINE